MTEFKNILVPTDFGESSNAALEIAIDLARKYGATLNVVHTYDVPSYTYAASASAVDLLGPVIEVARRDFDDTMKDIAGRSPNAKGFLRFGVPWQEILGVREEVGADLIVMGTHGRKGAAHALLGSVAEKIVRLSPVPVLTVHAAA
ncbi:MAG TPA: universal stress protein [Polyangiaceae bacterium]|nr:universal stress protein [Polyangiaceae bacterium]